MLDRIAELRSGDYSTRRMRFGDGRREWTFLFDLLLQRDEATSMKITEILERQCVRVPLKATEKNAVIAELVDVLCEAGHAADREDFLQTILAREQTRSTGIGLGLAVPHGKPASCRNLVMALGKAAEPIEFDSADGRPVTVVAMLASPADQTGPHIQALAHVSRLWQTNGFRVAMAQATTADELFAAIERYQS